jgi:hypothetical protein
MNLEELSAFNLEGSFYQSSPGPLTMSKSLIVNSTVRQLLKSHVPGNVSSSDFSSINESTTMSSSSVGVSIPSGGSDSLLEGEDT